MPIAGATIVRAMLVFPIPPLPNTASQRLLATAAAASDASCLMLALGAFISVVQLFVSELSHYSNCSSEIVKFFFYEVSCAIVV
jgi:hypothetical protein